MQQCIRYHDTSNRAVVCKMALPILIAVLSNKSPAKKESTRKSRSWI